MTRLVNGSVYVTVPNPTGNKLLKVLQDATRQDLLDLEEEIDTAQNQLDYLRAVRQLLRIKFGMVKPRNKVGKTKTFKNQERLFDIAHYLLSHGPTKQAIIASELNIPSGSLSELINEHPWFTKCEKGITLTEEGKKNGRK